jgi:hypothetical protein
MKSEIIKHVACGIYKKVNDVAQHPAVSEPVCRNMSPEFDSRPDTEDSLLNYSE